MVMATRVAGNKEGDGDGNGEDVGDGNGNKGGGRATATSAMAMARVTTWVMATAPRGASNIEGNGKRWQGRWQRNKVGC
jgi:hypothetical protein